MAVKYQVFVSSTFEDLKDERNAVIRMILELGHIPVGMEMFSAADEEQWQIIARHIDESDYYCVVIGQRYGSETGGISYTRKEYEYAVSRRIPVLGFIIDDSAPLASGKVDKATAKVRKLNEFKSLVRSKPISSWSSAADLYGKASVALGKQFTMNPRDGWVRATSIAGPEVTAELTRLSAENASLRRDLKQAQLELEAEQSTELQDLWEKMKLLEVSLSYRYKPSGEWLEAKDVRYSEVFDMLSPMLAGEMERNEAANTLCLLVKEDKGDEWDIVALNHVDDLLADIKALGLVEPSKRKHPVADTNSYWTLTELGHALQTHVRVAFMDAAVERRLAMPDSAPERPEDETS